MERCRGKTKAGARCKRGSGEGSDFCSLHAGQAKTPPNESRGRASRSKGDPRRHEDDYDDMDRIWGLATIAVLVGAFFLFRGTRIF